MAGPDQPAAVLQGVAAGYGGAPILREVDLALHPGEIFALLGPNGAGKSTLVRLLTGALAPSAGLLEIAGGRASVGLAPQEIGLWPFLTVRENVVAFARLAGARPGPARESAREAIALARCEAVAQARVSRLSGGYRRRANMAAALARRPRLIVLDEPMAGVDLEARRAIAQSLRGVRAQGAAVLLVTHDFEEADALADRAGVLRAGRLVDQGPPAQLIARAFGAASRIDVALAAAPCEAGRARLQALGARARGEAGWSLWREIADWNVQPLMDELAAAGLEVREVRVRRPGLEDVYEALTAA